MLPIGLTNIYGNDVLVNADEIITAEVMPHDPPTTEAQRTQVYLSGNNVNFVIVKETPCEICKQIIKGMEWRSKL